MNLHLLNSDDPFSQYYNIGCNSLTTNTLTTTEFTTTNITSTGTITANNINASGVINASGTTIGSGGLNIANNGTFIYNSLNRLIRWTIPINPNYAITGSPDFTNPIAMFFYPGNNNYLKLFTLSVNMNGFGNTLVTVLLANMNGVISPNVPPTIAANTISIVGNNSWISIQGPNTTLPATGTLVGVFISATGSASVARAYSIDVVYG
jgi:hypothetical protein